MKSFAEGVPLCVALAVVAASGLHPQVSNERILRAAEEPHNWLTGARDVRSGRVRRRCPRRAQSARRLPVRQGTRQRPAIRFRAASVHRCAEGADYVAVIDRLIAAGANITVAGHGAGRSILQMAEGNTPVQDALRRHGAS